MLLSVDGDGEEGGGEAGEAGGAGKWEQETSYDCLLNPNSKIQTPILLFALNFTPVAPLNLQLKYVKEGNLTKS